MMNKQHETMLRAIPWVTELTRGEVMCDGLIWSKISGKHLHAHGRDRSVPALGIPDNAHCRFHARWRFVTGDADQFMGAKTGNYCIHHLYSQGLRANMTEDERFDTWLREYRDGMDE